MLARTLESFGLATVLVTGMPYWAERIGVPRTLAVEYPFGHTLGRPHDRAGQLRVVRQALTVLESAAAPGTIVHSPEQWDEETEAATAAWQPPAPSPIIAKMAPQIRRLLRERRRSVD